MDEGAVQIAAFMSKRTAVDMTGESGADKDAGIKFLDDIEERAAVETHFAELCDPIYLSVHWRNANDPFPQADYMDVLHSMNEFQGVKTISAGAQGEPVEFVDYRCQMMCIDSQDTFARVVGAPQFAYGNDEECIRISFAGPASLN